MHPPPHEKGGRVVTIHILPQQDMVAGCKYSHRLDKFKEDGLVWGVRGEYSA